MSPATRCSTATTPTFAARSSPVCRPPGARHGGSGSRTCRSARTPRHCSGPSAGFYADLVKAGGQALIDGLDYVGLDMFPGVFRAIGDGTMRTASAGLLRYHRDQVLVPAGLGHLPLHITEHGWPTGPDRTPERQAAAVRDVIETVLEFKGQLHIGAYELFSLRDADSGNPDVFHQFGIMTDTYEPKPAYEAFKQLVEECRTAPTVE
jgi:hypothetical protein